MSKRKTLAQEIELSAQERSALKKDDRMRHPHVATMYAAMGHRDIAESLTHGLLPHLQRRVCTIPRRSHANPPR